MRMTFRVISAIVLMCFILVLLSDSTSADPAYNYNDETHELTVTEDVPDYANPSDAPWAAHLDYMTDLTVSEGVTTVGSNAFGGASLLQNVTLPSTLASIGGGAFSDCPKLASVTLKSSPSAAGPGAFEDSGSDVDGFRLLVIAGAVPSGLFSPSAGHSVCILSLELTEVVTISADAFAGAEIGSAVTLPMSVSYVGDRAFAGSTLESVRVEGSPVFGSSVFEGCPFLTRAEIGSVKSVPASMFRGCASLSDVVFSERISEISESSFEGTGVRELVFPGTLKKVGTSAFASCAQLEHLAFTDDLDYLEDYAFQGCAGLKRAEVQRVSHPGSYVFDGCLSLQRAYCPTEDIVFPAGEVYRDLGDGPGYFLIRYDFGELDGSCTLFSDTVMRSSYIDGSENRRFDYWADPDGNKVSDTGSLTASTVLTAHWVQAEGADGTFDVVLCVLSVACAAAACLVCFRRS